MSNRDFTGNTAGPCQYCGDLHNPLAACYEDKLKAQITRLRRELEEARENLIALQKDNEKVRMVLRPFLSQKRTLSASEACMLSLVCAALTDDEHKLYMQFARDEIQDPQPDMDTVRQAEALLLKHPWLAMSEADIAAGRCQPIEGVIEELKEKQP